MISMVAKYFWWCRTCEKKVAPGYHKKKHHDVVKIKKVAR